MPVGFYQTITAHSISALFLDGQKQSIIEHISCLDLETLHAGKASLKNFLTLSENLMILCQAFYLIVPTNFNIEALELGVMTTE